MRYGFGVVLSAGLAAVVAPAARGQCDGDTDAADFQAFMSALAGGC